MSRKYQTKMIHELDVLGRRIVLDSAFWCTTPENADFVTHSCGIRDSFVVEFETHPCCVRVYIYIHIGCTTPKNTYNEEGTCEESPIQMGGGLD